MTGLVVFAVIVTLMVLTARHRIYRTKVANEKLNFYGHRLQPRLYSQKEYRKLYETRTHRFRTDLKYNEFLSDYRDIAACSVFFPVYWFVVAVKASSRGLGSLITTGIKKTPGELKLEEEQRAAARKLREQKYEEMYQEIQRLRREQENEW